MIKASFCDGIDLFHARRATTDPLRDAGRAANGAVPARSVKFKPNLLHERRVCGVRALRFE
jgi:hypothetical protein